MITQTIDLNMIPESAPVIVHVNQYDTGEGRLIVNLYDGEQSYTPASGATAKVQGTKPDKKGFSYDATISGSTVTVDIEEQMTCVAGRTRTNLIITEGERKTGTFVFWLEVQATGLADDVDTSETVLPEYIDGAQRAASEAIAAAATVGQARDEAVAARNEAVPAAQTATTKAAEASTSASSASASATAAEASAQRVEGEALTAEAWAVGTHNGEQIPSTDPAYNNHARYWAGQAEQFAQGGLIYKGSIAFANIPTSGMKVGDMYNITDDFTTDSRFQEGAGISVKAGSNIAWNGSKWDLLAVGAAGHEIVNSSGTVMTARSKLKFMNSTVTDDSTNDTTIVTPQGSSISLPLSIDNGGTGNTVGYIRTGRKSNSAIGSGATAEGYDTTASGNYSHAEGMSTTASGNYSHAEGEYSTASGYDSHAEGQWTKATAYFSHAEGNYTNATGKESHAEGDGSTASVRCSHAEGLYTIADSLTGHAQGHYNKNMTSSGAVSGTDGDAMVIGNGTTTSSRSNAFRVTFAGEVYGKSSYNSSGADYAEFFEWKDGNMNAEDRVGYFVTLDGDKIKKANADDYILGIISGQPSVVGNGDEDWLGRWQRDDFGRFIWGDIETENSEGEKETIHTILPNPDYDSTQKYIERKDRKEWDYVGMLGNIAVRDDGTCEVNGFCTVADGGVATKAETGYRVIKRVSDNVVKIILK